jgi:murein L,D-transpeptidase YafK
MKMFLIIDDNIIMLNSIIQLSKSMKNIHMNRKYYFHSYNVLMSPRIDDVEHAKTLVKPIGGDIKIHGYKNGIGFVGKFVQLSNWTFGCIALTNKDVDELYKTVKI